MGSGTSCWSEPADTAWSALLSRALQRTRLRDGDPGRIAAAVQAHRPNALSLAIMDAAVMSALRPALPDEARPGRRIALWVLYLRSHWLKMPPPLLARHLATKLFIACAATSTALRKRRRASPLNGRAGGSPA